MKEYLDNVKKSKDPFNEPQLAEWIKTKKSEVTGEEYQYNDIELIEDILSYFGGWIYEIKETHFVQDKFGISVTVEVVLLFVRNGRADKSFGIASEFAPNTKYLTLATPKAASMAFKSAIAIVPALIVTGTEPCSVLTAEKSEVIVPEADKFAAVSATPAVKVAVTFVTPAIAAPCAAVTASLTVAVEVAPALILVGAVTNAAVTSA